MLTPPLCTILPYTTLTLLFRYPYPPLPYQPYPIQVTWPLYCGATSCLGCSRPPSVPYPTHFPPNLQHASRTLLSSTLFFLPYPGDVAAVLWGYQLFRMLTPPLWNPACEALATAQAEGLNAAALVMLFQVRRGVGRRGRGARGRGWMDAGYSTGGGAECRGPRHAVPGGCWVEGGCCRVRVSTQLLKLQFSSERIRPTPQTYPPIHTPHTPHAPRST